MKSLITIFHQQDLRMLPFRMDRYCMVSLKELKRQPIAALKISRYFVTFQDQDYYVCFMYIW